MLRHLLTEAQQSGCHKVQLLTHKRHATDGAHDLYKSPGFVAEEKASVVPHDPGAQTSYHPSARQPIVSMRLAWAFVTQSLLRP